MRRIVPAIREAGGDLVVVGTGTPGAAKAFQKDLGLSDIRLFSDQARRGYDLVGFRRGFATLLRPRAVRNYLRAFISGHRWRSKGGDALQQGGVLMVRPNGAIAYRQASQESGDHPRNEDILAAVLQQEGMTEAHGAHRW